MTSTIKGKSVDEAIALKDKFLDMLVEDKNPDDLGRLSVFANVKRFPVRVKCATLIWRTLEDALVLANGSISTEGDS